MRVQKCHFFARAPKWECFDKVNHWEFALLSLQLRSMIGKSQIVNSQSYCKSANKNLRWTSLQEIFEKVWIVGELGKLFNSLFSCPEKRDWNGICFQRMNSQEIVSFRIPSTAEKGNQFLIWLCDLTRHLVSSRIFALQSCCCSFYAHFACHIRFSSNYEALPDDGRTSLLYECEFIICTDFAILVMKWIN